MWIDEGSEAAPNPKGSLSPPRSTILSAEELTCPSCLEAFDTPYFLPCEHKVCGGCLTAVAGGVFVCPTCRATSTPFADGAQVPQLDIDVKVREALGECQAPVSHPSAICDKCESVAASVTCGVCDVDLCAGCNAEHHKGKLRTHPVERLEEAVGRLVPYCKKPGHGRYRTDLMCKDTKELLCLLCFQVDPQLKNKKCIPVSSALEEMRGQFKTSLETAEGIKTKLKYNVGKVDQITQSTREATAKEILHIRNEFRTLKAELEKKELQLVETAVKQKDKKISILEAQRKTLTSAISQLNLHIMEGSSCSVSTCGVEELAKHLKALTLSIESLPHSVVNFRPPTLTIPCFKFNRSFVHGLDSFARLHFAEVTQQPRQGSGNLSQNVGDRNSPVSSLESGTVHELSPGSSSSRKRHPHTTNPQTARQMREVNGSNSEALYSTPVKGSPISHRINGSSRRSFSSAKNKDVSSNQGTPHQRCTPHQRSQSPGSTRKRVDTGTADTRLQNNGLSYAKKHAMQRTPVR